MTTAACIRFAPLWTFERHCDPRWNRPGRALYEPGSLRFLPSLSEVPLLVDHDLEREIGRVHELVVWDDLGGPWFVARATIHDAPAWLRKYETKASFGHRIYKRRTYTDCELIAGALVHEVSVLSPSVKPAEPLAEVLILERTAPAERALASGEQVFYNEPGTIIRRPNCGRVLHVR